jgi:SPP1 family predicted phage head-tail adaptor
MDRRVELLAEIEQGQTPSGQRLLEWLPVAKVWAERIDPRGRELFTAQQTVAKVDCVFRIRYREGVTTKQRLKDLRDGRTYDITAVLPALERREALDLVATARAEAAA